MYIANVISGLPESLLTEKQSEQETKFRGHRVLYIIPKGTENDPERCVARVNGIDVLDACNPRKELPDEMKGIGTRYPQP